MKHNNMQEFIKEMKAVMPETPAHRASLRRAILLTEQKKHSIVTFLPRRLIKGVSMNKIFAVIGTSVAVPALVLTLVFSPLNPHVYAVNMTKDSVAQVHQLSSEEKAAIKQKLSADPDALLTDAANAKDLTRISREDLNSLRSTMKAKAQSTTKTNSDGSSTSYGSLDGDVSDMKKVTTGNVPAPDRNSPPTDNSGGSGTSPATSGDQSNSENKMINTADIDAMLQKQSEEAKEFVKYTNTRGDTVVIGFDGKKVPVYTIVLSA